MNHHLWIIATGALCNAACALLGSFLVLRRMSLLGDAISHAILPGLALSFLATGSRAVAPMFLGAMAMGLLTAFLTQRLQRFARVTEDVSMGVVFTSLFAFGVILINQARHVDLDPGCVLYGLIELTPLDTWALAGAEIPRAPIVLGIVFALDCTFVVLFWKELKLAAFDPALATTLGFSATALHYLLMGLVAGTTVAAFEAVGSVLVVAMLIAPAAAAQLLTDRLSLMVVLSVVIGVSSSAFGYWGAVEWNTSVAGMMATAAGAHYFVALLLAPRYGLISKALQRLEVALRIVMEDVLALLYRWSEVKGDAELGGRYVVAALGGGIGPRLAVWVLQLRQQVGDAGGGLRLTARGKARARELIRSHRLWETYLARELGIPLDHVHDPAERMEHYITESLRDSLKDQLATPEQDPHGRPIPRE